MKKIFLLALLVVLSSCVSFTTSNTPKIDVVDGIGSKPTVLLKVNTYATDNGVVSSWKQFELNREFNLEVKEAFAKSNMFGEVSANVKNPDYELDVVIKDTYAECFSCNVINIATIGLIPSWTNESFYYQAVLVNTKTKQTTTFDYYEKSKEVRQILLMFAYPFMYDAEDNMHKNVFNNLVVDTAKEIVK